MAAECYTCIFRRDVPGDRHSSCANGKARVTGNERAIRKGWFFHPFNFDPIWLILCDGYKSKEEINESKEEKDMDI